MSFFEYDLPTELIAQEPLNQRDQARLLHLDRRQGACTHRHFFALPHILCPGDLLVLNNTQVLPARLYGYREATGGQWEGLYLGQTPEGLWELLAKTRGDPNIGESFVVAPGVRLTLRGRTPERHWLVQVDPPQDPAIFLTRFGVMPLPPYIRKGQARPEDTERYQTVFATRPGAIAAPTAGLHFTPHLLEQLVARGIDRTEVTLHVGLGTFEPIKAQDPKKHPIHREWCAVPAEAVAAIQQCKQRGGRVIAVGTTVTRTLEGVAARGDLEPWQGETDLYIQPPYNFKIIDGLITNFHLPRTTLLLLVGAFAGEELLRSAYQQAIARRYRFYSYGDAMLIL